jgi:hypothetical protein
MAADLFAPKTNGYHYLQPIEDPFRWCVAVFMADGASVTIRRANAVPLRTFYPIRFNGKGEPIPLWRNYLFLEWREQTTLEICRTTIHFIRIISARDKEGVSHPIFVRRNGIQESMAMVLEGRFNERVIERRFYGRGHIVRVIEGHFIDKKVKLEQGLLPEMPGNYKVKIDIGGIKGSIEIYKLAL